MTDKSISATINNYLDIAQSLNEPSTESVLSLLKERMENSSFYLPFIGQFSAGKSRLINNLLNQELLPTKNVETTAFVTYISFSEEEYAQLVMEDGTIKNIQICEVKDYDYSTTNGVEKVKELHIGINNDLVKNGLVIVDTPGVNTIIEDHIRQTEDLLSNSLFVVYVLAKDLTDIDCQMIQAIEKKQIKSIFVRTHMDYINSGEESPVDIIESQTNTLNSLLHRVVDFYPLSNVLDSKSSIWIPYFDKFKAYISSELSENIDGYKFAIIKNRLNSVRDLLIQVISEQISLVESNKGKKSSELNAEQVKLETLLSSHQKNIDGLRSSNKLKYDSMLATVLSIINSEAESSKNNFANSINGKPYNELRENTEVILNKRFEQAVKSINDLVSSEISKWQRDLSSEVKNELIHFTENLNSMGYDIKFNFDDSVSLSYEEKMRAKSENFKSQCEQLNSLIEKSEEQLNEYGIRKEDVQNAIDAIQAAQEEYEGQLAQLDESYVPKYIHIDSKLGKILKGVGMAADVAMLLIPGEGWAAAGAKCGAKAAQIAGKGGKLAASAAKALTVAEKGAKILATTDGVKDMATLMKGMDRVVGGKGAQRTQKDGSILDFLSLSYWFQKMGESIEPSRDIIDKEFEMLYFQKREQLLLQARDKADQITRQRADYGQFVNDASREEYRKAEYLRQRERAEKEFEKERDNLEAEKSQRLQQELCSQMKKYFNTLCLRYVKDLEKQITRYTENQFVVLLNSLTEDIYEKTISIKTQLKNLEGQAMDSNIESSIRLDELKELKMRLI